MGKAHPEISVIVPVYNVEKSLSRCIDSILGQTFTDFELILVDDGSTDVSGNICDMYAAENDRITVIHKENGGVSVARNVGIDVADGKYITFVDSDDYVDAGFLENAFSIMEKTKVDLYISGIQMERFEEGNIKDIKRFTFDNEEIVTTVDLLKKENIAYPTICISGPWCKFYKKKIVLNNNIRFNVKMSLGEDGLFNLDYLHVAKDIYCDVRIYYHYIRENENSLFSRFNADIFNANNIVFSKKIKMLSEFGAEFYYIQRNKNELAKRVAATIVHYYQHYSSTNKEETIVMMRELSRHPVLKEINKRDFNHKEQIIFTLLKLEAFWLIHLICWIKYVKF